MNRAGGSKKSWSFFAKKFGINAVVLALLLAATRQINLWTYPLGIRKRESVTVATNQ